MPAHEIPEPIDHDSSVAVIYIRARADSKPAETALVRQQHQQCRQLADQLGASIEAEYIDRGASANDPGRAGLCGLLERLRQPIHLDYVLTSNRDRLARDMQLAEIISRDIARVGATLRTPNDDANGGPDLSTVIANRWFERSGAL